MHRALRAQGGFGEADEPSALFGDAKVPAAPILRQPYEVLPLRQRDRAKTRLDGRGPCIQFDNGFRVRFAKRTNHDGITHGQTDYPMSSR